MGIVGALDLHRSQITYQWLDPATGDVHRGRIAPGAREPLRTWLAGFEGTDAHFALEATTGWRFVVEELRRAGCTPPRRPSGDQRSPRPEAASEDRRADCEHMAALLAEGRLPECWIRPPGSSRLVRSLVCERPSSTSAGNGCSASRLSSTTRVPRR